MQEVLPFCFNDKQVRAFPCGETILFPAKDIADALGYSQSQNMLAKVDEEDIFKSSIFDDSKRLGLPPASKLINESGVYAAIFGSKKEGAKKFKRWVTSEVLPAVRKHGSYSIDKNAEELYKMAKTIVNQHESQQVLMAQVDEATNRAAVAEEKALAAEADNQELRDMLHNSSVRNIMALGQEYRKKAIGYLKPEDVAIQASTILINTYGLKKISAQKVNKLLSVLGYQVWLDEENREQEYNGYGNQPVNVKFSWYVGPNVPTSRYRIIPTAVTGKYAYLNVSYRWSPSVVTEIVDRIRTTVPEGEPAV
jgi:prophage antirepressor-like protein